MKREAHRMMPTIATGRTAAPSTESSTIPTRRLGIGSMVARLAATVVRGHMPNPTALLETSLGNFTVEIFTDRMPITAGNFVKLAKSGFYDGLHFHRVIS